MVVLMRWWVLVLVAWCTACTGGESGTDAESHEPGAPNDTRTRAELGWELWREVRIAPEFTQDELELIVPAAREWCGAAPREFCFPVMVDDVSPNVLRCKPHSEEWGQVRGQPESPDCVHHCEDGRGMLFGVYDWRRATIELCPDVVPGVLWLLMVHELGHALGGPGHVEDTRSVMAPSPTGSQRCIDWPAVELVCRGAECRGHSDTTCFQ